MNTIKKLLAVASVIALGAGCAGSTNVKAGFRVERLEGDGDAPVSEVFLMTDIAGFKAEGIGVGRGQGCAVVDPHDFDFPDESVAEVYCYFAGGGDVFQARVNSSGDLEIVRHTVTETLDYEAGTNSIEITDPESVYTFDLEEGSEVQGM